MKVKRDGPRGYRLIDAHRFDPAVHKLFDPPHPLDHDRDGKPGGSLPKAQRKPRGKAA